MIKTDALPGLFFLLVMVGMAAIITNIVISMYDQEEKSICEYKPLIGDLIKEDRILTTSSKYRTYDDNMNIVYHVVLTNTNDYVVNEQIYYSIPMNRTIIGCGNYNRLNSYYTINVTTFEDVKGYLVVTDV